MTSESFGPVDGKSLAVSEHKLLFYKNRNSILLVSCETIIVFINILNEVLFLHFYFNVGFCHFYLLVFSFINRYIFYCRLLFSTFISALVIIVYQIKLNENDNPAS